MKHLKYDHLPIFAITTHGHDFKTPGSLELVAKTFQIPQPKYCNHVHRDVVIHVESAHDLPKEGDAMITQVKNLPLMICHADCQAAIFLDREKKVLAVAHSGWRGSNLNIYGKVVDEMRKLGCLRIEVAISPSLGPDKSEFINYKTELNPSLWKYQHKPNHFDFWQLSIDQLKEKGVEDVYVSRICTYSNPNYFSYRRDKTKGRDATIAML